MALTDYGVIATKNGKLITGIADTKGLYRINPKSTLGFEITNENQDILNVLYVGNWNFHVGLYKQIFTFGKNGINGERNYLLYLDNPFKKKVWYLKEYGINIKIKQIQDCRYMMSFKLDRDFYNIYFGYGVEYGLMEYFKKHKLYNISNKELLFLKRYNMLSTLSK